MAEELKAAGESIAAATQRGVDRELELSQETELMKQAKETDKAAAQQALKVRVLMTERRVLLGSVLLAAATRRTLIP